MCFLYGTRHQYSSFRYIIQGQFFPPSLKLQSSISFLFCFSRAAVWLRWKKIFRGLSGPCVHCAGMVTWIIFTDIRLGINAYNLVTTRIVYEIVLLDQNSCSVICLPPVPGRYHILWCKLVRRWFWVFYKIYHH